MTILWPSDLDYEMSLSVATVYPMHDITLTFEPRLWVISLSVATVISLPSRSCLWHVYLAHFSPQTLSRAPASFNIVVKWCSSTQINIPIKDSVVTDMETIPQIDTLVSLIRVLSYVGHTVLKSSQYEVMK